MFKNILIATDGSELAAKAVDRGLALAQIVGAAVTFVTVTADWSATEMADRAERGEQHPVEGYEGKVAARASAILSDCAKAAQKTGVRHTTVHVKDRPAAEGIIESAKVNDCDLIVMASHGRGGVGRLLLGSVATKVLTYGTVPILICR